MSTYFTGDTITIQVTFGALAPLGQVGSPQDPDSQLVTFSIYDADATLLNTYTAVRDSVGVYHYDWTMPQEDGTYYVEFKGNYFGKPQLKRTKFVVRFRPSG